MATIWIFILGFFHSKRGIPIWYVRALNFICIKVIFKSKLYKISVLTC